MYYIIEHDVRPDSIVNTTETGRTTFASALAFYYDRMSKLVVSVDFTSAHLMLVEEDLTVLKQDHINTLYEPIVEPEPTPEVEPEVEVEVPSEEEEKEEETE